jgi:hypothetical protein
MAFDRSFAITFILELKATSWHFTIAFVEKKSEKTA